MGDLEWVMEEKDKITNLQLSRGHNLNSLFVCNYVLELHMYVIYAIVCNRTNNNVYGPQCHCPQTAKAAHFYLVHLY
jgi:hypothetical protein